MRKSHFNEQFLLFSVVGAHNQQVFFACSNEEKKLTKTTKCACSSPISMDHDYNTNDLPPATNALYTVEFGRK